MFELNEQINLYKNELTSNQSLSEKDVKELISHLHDDIENLKEMGLSDKESFWVARHRIGDTKALKFEYSKVNRGRIVRRSLVLLLLGYFLLSLIPKLVFLITIPLYTLDLNWMLFTTPIFGPDYSTPIPLFIFIIAIISGFLYIFMREKIIFNKIQNHFIGINLNSIMKYRYIIPLFGLYVFTSVAITLTKLSMANYSPKLLGLVAASDSLFSVFWNAFLFICAIIFMITTIKTVRKELIVS